MKTFPTAAVIFLFLYSCTTHQMHRTGTNAAADTLILFEIQGKERIYAHLIANSTKRNLNPGDIIGTCEAFPKVMSVKWQKEIVSSQNYYNAGEYNKAADMLAEALKDEPDNPFILEAYGRALYKNENRKNESLAMYEKLMTIIDGQFKSENFFDPEKYVNVNMWFSEAYWKIGTLYLDVQEWKKAALNIQCALLVISKASSPRIWEQALAYLTEAYFELGEPDKAHYYCCQTLRRFPKNNYVLEYQNKIGKKCR